MMQNLLFPIVTGLVIATVTGLGWIAYHHPRAFDKIHSYVVPGVTSLALVYLMAIGYRMFGYVDLLAKSAPKDCTGSTVQWVKEIVVASGQLTITFWLTVAFVVLFMLLRIPASLKEWDKENDTDEGK